MRSTKIKLSLKTKNHQTIIALVVSWSHKVCMTSTEAALAIQTLARADGSEVDPAGGEDVDVRGVLDVSLGVEVHVAVRTREVGHGAGPVHRLADAHTTGVVHLDRVEVVFEVAVAGTGVVRHGAVGRPFDTELPFSAGEGTRHVDRVYFVPRQ